MNIKDIVKNNTVQFVRYRRGIAYYGVNVPAKGAYVFPVPLDDIGDATLELEDKAIMFMRYIKRAIGDGSFVPLASQLCRPIAQ